MGNSQAVVEFYRKAGIPEDRLAMIHSRIAEEEPPAVDPAARPRRARALLADAPLVLFAGRLAPQKGVADLIAAHDLLHYGMPELRTLIVGDGSLRPQLEELVLAYRHDHAIRFLGHRNDVPRLLAAADLLVLPSLYEGLPNVVLEAMRFAKPVSRHRRTRDDRSGR